MKWLLRQGVEIRSPWAEDIEFMSGSSLAKDGGEFMGLDARGGGSGAGVVSTWETDPITLGMTSLSVANNSTKPMRLIVDAVETAVSTSNVVVYAMPTPSAWTWELRNHYTPEEQRWVLRGPEWAIYRDG